MQIIYFLILIGVLIFIHEFGHYFFAKLFGVKVERFAIGMGPVVPWLSFTRGETDYTICALPIGGYVKMFGMQPEELYDDWGQPLGEEEAARAFVRKPIWQRAVIIAAGPVINLIFPIFIYFFMGLGQTTLPPSTVGEVTPESPAAMAKPMDAGQPAGLQAGDRITAIDDAQTRYWGDLTDIVEDSAEKELTFTVLRGEQSLRYKITPAKHTKTDRLGLFTETYGIIGITSETYGPIIAVTDPQGPAAQAGLKTFDKIVAVGQTQTNSFIEIQEAIDATGGEPQKLLVLRPKDIDALGGGLQVADHLTLEVTPVKDERGRWSLGVEAADMYISSVEADSPASQAGLQVGDEIVSVDGIPYNKMRLLKYDVQQRFWEKMQAEPDTEKGDLRIDFKVEVRRGGELTALTYSPRIREFKGQFNEMVPRIVFGFDSYHSYDLPEPVPVPMGTRVVYAASNSVEMTWRFTKMMVQGIVQLVRGRVSTDTIGGPIMIFDIAAKAGRQGLQQFLWMMALISINLGLINLLPIPVLDGGHLMLLTIEAVKRKELTQRTRQIAYYIGFSLIVMLMLLAMKNDIERYWQDFAAWLNV